MKNYNHKTGSKIIIVSRCDWTLFNFRYGLMKLLIDQGNSVIGAGASTIGFKNKIEALGVIFKKLPVDKKGISPVKDLKLLYTFYRFYSKEQPEIVHHFTIKPVIFGSIAARLAGIPKIINTITGLGYVYTEKDGGLLRKIVNILYKISLSCANYTFFQNKDDLKLFQENSLVDHQNVGLVPGSGVNCSRFSPKFALDSDRKNPPIFLMISRLLKDKGVYEFVEAARIVKKSFPHTKFQLLGMRDIRNPNVVPVDDLQDWEKQGLIEWIGHVDDVRPFIEKANVIVLPSSYREGVPRALLEAAAMGKPIITTDSIGCRDTVDDGITGILIPSKDAHALSHAMLKMIEDLDMRLSMGRKGREKILKEFDEKIVLNKTIEVYNNDYI